MRDENIDIIERVNIKYPFTTLNIILVCFVRCKINYVDQLPNIHYFILCLNKMKF